MSREEFLEALPVGKHFDPCKCTNVQNYGKSETRNMWVHSEINGCGKPSGAHRGYSPFCYECGQPFTYKVAPVEVERYPFCPDCE